jgi:hypothetical protein
MSRHAHRPSHADKGRLYAHGKPNMSPLAEGADAGIETVNVHQFNRACDRFWRKRGLPTFESYSNSWGFGKGSAV